MKRPSKGELNQYICSFKVVLIIVEHNRPKHSVIIKRLNEGLSRSEAILYTFNLLLKGPSLIKGVQNEM